ncbi:hypothetical protein [Paracraurococcus ruber]|uniref:O-antigen ligase like membrane protein n=1 Tax=Paracraurococcus ruber TaxID=77675 RepID=A0ABS1CUQ2_9PROT|nr:hypothetical protein [Paracraurococcus ruber]MBK1658093.1 hypothetical protein [Paracraurococcus ruber]TDG32346.1 hypothetical protein E2C05_07450 [Paracraurococcus ruber]
MGIAIYLQKLAIPGSGRSASVAMLLFMACLMLGHVVGAFALDARRLLLYFLFCAVVLLSQATQPEISLASMVLLLLLYAQLVFRADMGAALHRRYLRAYQSLMVPPALVALLQLAWQFAFGFGRTLSIEDVLPRDLLLSGFYYEAPLFFGTLFVRPNGYVFLEPSFLSAFLACALLTELCVFRRWRFVLLYAAALVGCLGGTGALMAVLGAPFVLARLPPRQRLVVMFAAAIVLIGLVAWKGEFLLMRLEGFSVQGSSERGRVIQPAMQLLHLLGEENGFLLGRGAGQVEDGIASWPVVKLLWEYGVLAVIAFLALMQRAVTWRLNPWLVLPLMVVFHLTGGYLLNPVAVMLLIIFCTLPTPADAASPGRHAAAR